MPHALPTVPVSCGALLLDEQGRLLVLKPTYKAGWTLPGGVMEDTGESPWDACRREVREETGLTVREGRLVVVDTRPGDQLGLRYLFHCGTVPDADAATIRVQPGEIARHRFVPVPEALELLRPAVRRRAAAGLRTSCCVYLEDGQPVPGVG